MKIEILRNNPHLILAGIVIGAIILFLIFRPEPKFTIIEKKIGDIVYSKDFLLKVIAVKDLLGNVTQIDLAVRNITNKPIRFLVTDRADKSDDLHYKKYYFVIERNNKIYSTCCSHHLVEPGDESGRFDYDFEVYFDGHIFSSDSCSLIVSEDPEGREVVSKIKLTTNKR